MIDEDVLSRFVVPLPPPYTTCVQHIQHSKRDKTIITSTRLFAKITQTYIIIMDRAIDFEQLFNIILIPVVSITGL